MGPRRSRALAILLTGFGLSVVPAPTHAVTVDLIAVLDNMIQNDDERKSNGIGQRFCVGVTGQSPDFGTRRSLLKFNIAAAGIPAGSTITAATLQLYLDRAAANAGPLADIMVHRVNAAWGEGGSDAPNGECKGGLAQLNDATWVWRLYNPSNEAGSPEWSKNGGDYEATPSAASSITVVLNEFKSWSGAGLVADVQGWLASPATNHGWLLKRATELDSGTSVRFRSRHYTTAANRPKLTIVYDLPGTTGACCLDNGTCSAVSAATCASQSGAYQGNGVACGSVSCPIVLEPFVDALPIPAVAQPVAGTPGGAATYHMAIREVQQRFHRDLPMTTVWGFGDGSSGAAYPGPTIEAASGQPVTVAWINELRDTSLSGSPPPFRTNHYLDVPGTAAPPGCSIDGAADLPKVVIHLHGGHVPAAYDGYPEDAFLPGNQSVYVYPNSQLPGNLWYHDDALGISRLNVYMGLAGPYVIRDAYEQGLALPACPNPSDPSTCFEIGLAIQDRTFRPDGSLSYPSTFQDHFFGEQILVNGKVSPYLDVRQGKYRFRVLNGSTTRTYTLSLDRLDLPGGQDQSFRMIGTDSGLRESPLVLDELTLGPGERADVVVDFAGLPPSTEVVLTNSAPAPFPGVPGVGVIPAVMKFIVGNQPGHTTALPAVLRAVETIDELEALRTRDFVLDQEVDGCGGISKINGLRWDDIVEYPQLGTTEIWRFVNAESVMHPLHMHLVLLQVLDRTPVGGGSAVPARDEERGWKDTVQADAGMVTRVIARFRDFAGRFPYHSAILEHADHEMLRQFWTVGAVALGVSRTAVSWGTQAGATSYDVVRGDLGALLATDGNFALPSVTQTCLANDVTTTTVPDSAVPVQAAGFWYLARSNDTTGPSTYDSGSSSQVDRRDDEILASGNGCP